MRNSGEQQSKEEKVKELKDEEGECFYPHVYSVSGSVSAIVPRLPVKTVRLLQCLFVSVSNACMRAKTNANTLNCKCLCTKIPLKFLILQVHKP